MANYVVSDSTLTNIANIIREKSGLSAPIEFPNGFVNAIENINTDDENNFVITIIMDENEMYAPDCSYDEIIDAYDAGKNICVVGYQEIFDLNNDGVVGFFDEDTQSLIYTVTHNVTDLNSRWKETLHYTFTADGLTVDPNEDIYYDAEDANALPNDVANGKIFYNSNGRAIGTHTSGPVSVPAKEVNFRDYDGTVVYSYTPAEFATLSAMPANLDHTHDEIPLTAQGWNWSLVNAQAYVAKYGRLEVGQMYITTDGKTHVLIHLEKGHTSPILGCGVDGTVDVDWGDGTAHYTLRGTSTGTLIWTTTHNYAAPGNYDIKLTVTQGAMSFSGSSGNNQYSGVLRFSSGADTRNYAYWGTIRAVFFGQGVSEVGTEAFRYCYRLASITIPHGVTNIYSGAFKNCFALSSITIPDTVIDARTEAFNNCYGLITVAIPESMTGVCVFYSCYGLTYVAIPNGAIYINNSTFSNCYGLTCVNLPNSITSIGTSAFSNCYGVSEYHLESSVPPTLGSTAFNNIPTGCKIYVPYSADHSILNAYKTATNWSAYASYMQEEPQ